MGKNNECGRVFIKFIFMTLILILVITGIVFVVKKQLEDNSIKDVRTDLMYIQVKCKAMQDKHIIDANEQLLGESINEYAENEEVNEIVSKSDKWYKLSQEDLERIGLGNLKAKDGYLVNYEENDVIYAKGILIEENNYYKLSDLEAIEDKDKEQEEQGVQEVQNEQGEQEVQNGKEGQEEQGEQIDQQSEQNT